MLSDYLVLLIFLQIENKYCGTVNEFRKLLGKGYRRNKIRILIVEIVEAGLFECVNSNLKSREHEILMVAYNFKSYSKNVSNLGIISQLRKIQYYGQLIRNSYHDNTVIMVSS